MCENCKCESVEQEAKQVEISGEELMELLQSESNQGDFTYFREPIEFDDEEMSHMINSLEFIDGQSDATYWAGYWNTLLNAGIPEQLAVEILLSHQTQKYNETIQEMNVFMNVEMSKNQMVAVEKNQL